jgi:hypothetical protein
MPLVCVRALKLRAKHPQQPAFQPANGHSDLSPVRVLDEQTIGCDACANSVGLEKFHVQIMNRIARHGLFVFRYRMMWCVLLNQLD